MEFKITKDHDEIRTWIEEHGGKPSIKEKRGTQRGVLDICFDEYDDEHQLVSWEEFFDTLDALNLEFRYEINSQESREFSYTFLNNTEALKEMEDQNENINDMPEDDVPIENVVPSAPVLPGPDSVNSNHTYSLL
ncbi:MAG: hypothetical protein K0S38_1097 [Candidatus Paceibacter sp.]|jgi:hypothetical protein|nr:hypothetical protein [Candidatus Paceibacter sp.]